jgi:two-component system, sensor histidine kinase and response regulator
MKAEPLRILIVDDTPENLIALEALLRRDGLEILTAESGREALELLLQHDVALALLDVQMPEMDGFELAELMRGSARTRHVPIIFVTAGARDPRRVFKGYEAGAVDFLFKPIEPHILRSKVGVFLDLAAQREALARALRLNEYFIGVLGHDLRSPLGAMLASVELLDTQDELQRSTLRRVEKAGERMTALVDQLLDLTRARLGDGVGFANHRERIDLRELLQRAIDEQLAIHPQRTIAYEAPSPCVVPVDADRLLQVFANLLSNAIAHGEQGPVTARVHCDGAATVEIHNRGAISEAQQATLFEPFHQTRQGSRGLGLGLFIASEIAKAHGGTIEVESSPEAGTTMRVRIPQ